MLKDLKYLKLMFALPDIEPAEYLSWPTDGRWSAAGYKR